MSQRLQKRQNFETSNPSLHRNVVNNAADDERQKQRRNPSSVSAQEAGDPALAWSLLQMYGAGTLAARSVLKGEPMRTLPERLASILIDLGRDHNGIIRGLNFQSLAEMLGTYRETVGATLRAFRRQGFVELEYQYIQIRDMDSLREFSGRF